MADKSVVPNSTSGSEEVEEGDDKQGKDHQHSGSYHFDRRNVFEFFRNDSPFCPDDGATKEGAAHGQGKICLICTVIQFASSAEISKIAYSFLAEQNCS